MKRFTDKQLTTLRMALLNRRDFCVQRRIENIEDSEWVKYFDDELALADALYELLIDIQYNYCKKKDK